MPRPFLFAALLVPSLLHLAHAAPSTPAKAAPPALAVTPPLSGWNYALEDDELEAAWTWQAPLKASGNFETRVGMHLTDAGKGDHLLLRVEGDGKALKLSFWRVAGGKVERWGEPTVTVDSAAGGVLGVQQSGESVRALWNGRAVLSAWYRGGEGRIGVASRGNLAPIKGQLQPLAPVVFRDDFMTASGRTRPKLRPAGTASPAHGAPRA
jgi:hypothetical protein